MLSLPAAASAPGPAALFPDRPPSGGGGRRGGAGSWSVLRRKASEAAPVRASSRSAAVNLPRGGRTRCVAA